MSKIAEIRQVADRAGLYLNAMLAPETRKEGNLEERMSALIGIDRDLAANQVDLADYVARLEANVKRAFMKSARPAAAPTQRNGGGQEVAGEPQPQPQPMDARDVPAPPPDDEEGSAAWVMAGIPQEGDTELPGEAPQPAAAPVEEPQQQRAPQAQAPARRVKHANPNGGA